MSTRSVLSSSSLSLLSKEGFLTIPSFSDLVLSQTSGLLVDFISFEDLLSTSFSGDLGGESAFFSSFLGDFGGSFLEDSTFFSVAGADLYFCILSLNLERMSSLSLSSLPLDRRAMDLTW